MRVIADLASSRWLKPDPKWHSFSGGRPSTVRADEWPAWFSFWFSGCWRALAKGTAWAGFYWAILLLLFYLATTRAPVGRVEEEKLSVAARTLYCA